VPGVQDVTVHLDGGTMSVTSAEPVDFDALSAAVSEAGYTLGSR
jgi:copper chaperone CopZ